MRGKPQSWELKMGHYLTHISNARDTGVSHQRG